MCVFDRPIHITPHQTRRGRGEGDTVVCVTDRLTARDNNEGRIEVKIKVGTRAQIVACWSGKGERKQEESRSDGTAKTERGGSTCLVNTLGLGNPGGNLIDVREEAMDGDDTTDLKSAWPPTLRSANL